MAPVRGNRKYDLPAVSGRLRMSGRLHRQSLASTRPVLRAWISTCNFRFVLRKRHWHHPSSPTTSQITEHQSGSAHISPSLTFVPKLPLLPLLNFGPCCLWSRLLSSLSLHEPAEFWRSVYIPLMVPCYKRVGNGLNCRVNPGQIMPIDHYELFLQKIKWSARGNLLFHLILLC